MKYKAQAFFSIFAIILISLSSCEDPPTQAPPFPNKEFIAPDTILDVWVGSVKWNHLDSAYNFEIEFAVDSLIQDDDPSDSTLLPKVPYFVTRTTYFDEETSEWLFETGRWELWNGQYELRWSPNERDGNILYVGYFDRDSLKGFVTASGGYQGRWSLSRKLTHEVIE